MKKITILTLMLFGAIGFSQTKALKSASDSDYSQQSQRTTTVKFEKPVTAKNFGEFVPVATRTIAISKTTATEINHRGTLAVTMYTDKTVFEAAYNGTFVTENFAGGPGAGNIIACGPIVSSAGDGCFPAGELEDGFNITASSGGDVIYIGLGAIGNASTLMGANTFADYTLLNFAPDGAHAVGMGLFIDSVGNADVRIFDTSNTLIDTFTISNPSNTENFIGFISDAAIGKIEIQAEADAGELFGNLEFGTDPLGGGGGPCSEENPNDFTFENGLNVSPATAFMTANDITVAADENFTITNITASIFANGGIANVDVNYYSDAAGLPGTLLHSDPSVTIDSQTVIGNNFGLDVNELELTVPPYTFMGQTGVPTTYWIQLAVADNGGSGAVYWVVTSSSAVGNPTALFDGGWSIYDPGFDGVYIWDGTCDPLSVGENTLGGFTYYPNPTNGLLSLKSVNNIETVSIFNMLGQRVMDSKIGATSSELNISNLKTGTYLMQVTVDGQIGTFRVLKN